MYFEDAVDLDDVYYRDIVKDVGISQVSRRLTFSELRSFD
jgi:hypothetical protein